MGKAKLSNKTLRLLSQYEESIVGDFDWSFYFSDKQCHIQLWQKIVEILPEYFGHYKYYKRPYAFKETALELLGFNERVTNCCYACNTAGGLSDYHINCDYCPLGIHCSVLGWNDFCDGLYKDNLELAIKGAKSLSTAWKGGE